MSSYLFARGEGPKAVKDLATSLAAAYDGSAKMGQGYLVGPAASWGFAFALQPV